MIICPTKGPTVIKDLSRNHKIDDLTMFLS